MEEYMLSLYDVQGSILTQQTASDWKKIFVNSVTVLRFLKKKNNNFLINSQSVSFLRISPSTN